MKKLVIFLAFFLAGCLPIKEVYDRFAIVSTRCESGSAVSVGHGYFLTATHVLLCPDSGGKIVQFGVLRPEGIDSNPVFVDSVDDVSLFRSFLGRNEKWARIGHAQMGERLIWIQPVINRIMDTNQVNLFLNQGPVSQISDHYITIDHIGLPGMSGSGIWNSNGELVGIGDRLMRLFDQIVAAIAVRSEAFDTLLVKIP